ncbi:hypothetical protein [Gemmobacter denitrificans]|uniref:Uncharacterized protein n=1 Tax=Gemmobacter denitrificans TaxID=3123040 RepID=A0ABU8BUK2_9RHOB
MLCDIGRQLARGDATPSDPSICDISRSLRAPVFAVEYRKCPGVAATAVLEDLMLRIELVMQGEGL